MKQTDFAAFGELLTTVADYYGKRLAPATVQLYWNALGKLEFQAVKQLLNIHVQTSRFMPTISEVLDAAQNMDGRPNPEEAWATVAKTLNDERLTVVWTEEMATAFGVAIGLQQDRIAARMAFKESYQQAVAEARRVGRAVKWTASLGSDAMGREGPLIAAVKDGRLPAPYVAGLLPSSASVSPEVTALLAKVAEKKIAA